METMNVFVEQVTEEAQLAMKCGCGSCHPTATAYRNDPHYERHDPHLAEGPCCCGRFFVIGHDAATAQNRAKTMAVNLQQAGKAPKGYNFHSQKVPLTWGATLVAVSANLQE